MHRRFFSTELATVATGGFSTLPFLSITGLGAIGLYLIQDTKSELRGMEHRLDERMDRIENHMYDIQGELESTRQSLLLALEKR